MYISWLCNKGQLECAMRVEMNIIAGPARGQHFLFDKSTTQDAELDNLEDLVKKKFGKKSIQRAEGIRRKDIIDDFEDE